MKAEWYKDTYLYLETLIVEKDSTRDRCRIRKLASRYFLENDTLYYRDADGIAKQCLIREEAYLVVKEFHDGALGGHFGRDLTIKRIRERFWWPTIWRDVANYVKTCDICQRYGPLKRYNPLQPYDQTLPFEIVFMDFIVSLPTTPRKNRHIIMMTDSFTKWIEAKAVKEPTSDAAARFFMEIVARFGVPAVVVTDNGTHFKGKFAETCDKTGTSHRFATPYHPQTCGQDERTNGLLLNRLRKWRKDEYNRWDEDLPASILACNTRKVSTTSFSLMESLMGYTAGSAVSLKLTQKSKREMKAKLARLTEPSEESIAERIRKLETLRDEATRMRMCQMNRIKE